MAGVIAHLPRAKAFAQVGVDIDFLHGDPLSEKVAP